MTSPNEPAWASNAPYSGSQAADVAPDSGGGSGTTDVAKQEASNVAQSASGALQQVTSTAKDQAAGVAWEAKEHARNLVGETRDQVSQQAGAQKDKAVSSLRSLADELQMIADGEGGASGIATQLARQASDTTHKVAGFLEEREPGDLLDDLTSLARRRPGAFLLGAAVAGVAAGRLTKGLTSSSGQGDSPAYPSRGPRTAAAIDMPSVPQSYVSSGPQEIEPLAGMSQPESDFDRGTGAYPSETSVVPGGVASEWSDPAGVGRTEPGSGPVIP